MGLLADANLLVVGEMALGFERTNFIDQDFGIDDHAVSDDAELVGMERAGRHQVQNGFLAVYDQGVAGVVTALIAHDDIGVVGKKIDDLTLAFVAPLGTDDCDV